MKMMKKIMFILFCAAAVFLLVYFTAARKGETHVTYPVVDWTMSAGECDEGAVLYIASISSSVWDADENLFLHYFKDQSDGQNVFLWPVFRNGTCVEERYFTEQNYGNYSYADVSEIFEAVFRLAEKTSKEDPAFLLHQEGKLYCIAEKTAYIIGTDYHAVPDTISVGALANSERMIVYQVGRDGSFAQVCE